MSASPDNNGGAAAAPNNHASVETANAGNGPNPKPNPKKFACVLCRRRKLKCDSAKPACGTCSRLKHHCTYQDDAPKKPTAKRRNIKDLEARLAQVEGKLSQEKAKAKANSPGDASTNVSKDLEINVDWNEIDANMEWDPDLANATDPNLFGTGAFAQDPFSNAFFDTSMLPTGLQEPLPPQQCMDEMYDFYFTNLHSHTPCIHEPRFRASLQMGSHTKPIICLRYAIFALVATVHDPVSQWRDVFYQRARAYAEADELKGLGEHFITVQHAQTWVLLTGYEVRVTSFPRAWVSGGKTVRLCQMMGLDRLDKTVGQLKRTLPPAHDWVELEERRRTFWCAFCNDRWASAGTGWAMTIVEEDVMTNLPSSLEAFNQGTPEETLGLQSLFTAEGARRLSSFGGVVFMAALFGRNVTHMHRGHVDDNPADYRHGEFWKRHRKMDNVLSVALYSLPRHLKIIHNIKDPSVIMVNMNIHSSVICLHQAAIIKAEENKLDQEIIDYSRVRCAVAAYEIINVMKLCCNVETADVSLVGVDGVTRKRLADFQQMNPWVCFSLYVAAQVFLEICKRLDDDAEHAKANLEFVLSTLQVIQRKHAIVEAFLMQIRMDLKSIGLGEAFFNNDSRPYMPPVGNKIVAWSTAPASANHYESYEDWENRFKRFVDVGDVGSISSYAAAQYRSKELPGQSSTSESESPGKLDTPSDSTDTPTDSSGQSRTSNMPTRPAHQHSTSPGLSGYPITGYRMDPAVFAKAGVNDPTTFIFPKRASENASPPSCPFAQAPVPEEAQPQMQPEPVMTDFPGFDMTDPQFFDPSTIPDFDNMATDQNQGVMSGTDFLGRFQPQ